MSTSDYLRYLRAVKGGPTPQDIETATGVPAGAYRQIEQRYRAQRRQRHQQAGDEHKG
jgi:hypothetical protein